MNISDISTKNENDSNVYVIDILIALCNWESLKYKKQNITYYIRV